MKGEYNIVLFILEQSDRQGSRMIYLANLYTKYIQIKHNDIADHVKNLINWWTQFPAVFPNHKMTQGDTRELYRGSIVLLELDSIY